MRVRSVLLSASLALLVLAGCATQKKKISDAPTVPTLADEGSGSASMFDQDIRLRSGDQMEIRLGGVPVEEINQVTGTYTIDTEGYVNMPQIGRIRASGLTQEQLQSAIQTAYQKSGVYSNPTITVTVPLTARFVNVGGEVRQPQRIAYTPDLTVLSAITAAGGFTEYASQNRVRLYRGTEVIVVDMHKIRKDPGQDIPLQPGDTIEVMRSFF
jgi:polysaccharide export outer membrane protein